MVIAASATCALCKILRPAYNRLRKEPSLGKVAVLHLDADTQKVLWHCPACCGVEVEAHAAGPPRWPLASH